MELGTWLQEIGLGQYEALFRENDVDLETLPELTEADLQQLGISLGHRKRLLKAIRELAEAPRTAATGAPTPSAAPAQSPPPRGGEEAERRPITVMFCDLVGSTSLAAKLDAEDWRELVNAYLDEASKAVSQYGGHVLKKLGDGLMALFGYPRAQENDAERAARAGLAILRALDELNATNGARGLPTLAVRIGLESGPVVVDASGEVFGDAPNVASRVQSAADPGTLVVTATVQRQVAGLFVAEDKGPHELKGVQGKPTLYRLVRPSGAGRRAGGRSLTALVGRDEELATLARRWERARSGNGQFVQIVGEPGLGKSRLLEEFHLRLGETPHTWVEWASSQLLQNTPLHPLADWGRQRFTSEARFAELEAALAQVKLDPAEHASLLAPLLDISAPFERVPQLAADELRRRQLAAIVAWIGASARTQPIVLAFEDLHWADPTTLDLMKTLAERGGQSPLLVVATSRPEFRAPWTTRSHHSVVALSPLDRGQISQMVGAIAERHALSKEAIEGVTNRTAGVPLFIEEVTRLLLEGGAQTIPPTLQQSLAARLDRLGEAREVAQIGAVLGREFSHALLVAVADLAAPALEAALQKLAEADLLYVEGVAPAANYRFKHALIQDAAYDSLLKNRRQALHRRAAEALTASENPQPELVAHHFTESNQTAPAIEWWGKAGDAALRRSAFQEAISHLGKAIAMADKAEGISGQRRKLHVAYGNALIATHGYGAPETTEAFARARESRSGAAEAPEQFAVDYGLWVGSYLRGELPAQRKHAAAFLRDVARAPASPEACVAHRAAGITHWFAGEYNKAQRRLGQALALFRPGRDDDLAFRFGHDPGVGAMLYLAIAVWPQGAVDRARFLVESAGARIAHVTHAGSRAYAAMHAAMFELMRRDVARVASNASELARLADEHDLSLWRAFGVFLRGWVAAERGEVAAGLVAMRRGFESLCEQNAIIFGGLLRVAQAEHEASAGDPGHAVAILDEALALCDRTSHRSFAAELHRARGEMLLRRDPAKTAPAEEAFQAALAVAKRQETRSFELRAALALARLHQSTGRPAEAHNVLAPALENFTPTPEFPDIAEAKTLLDALCGHSEVQSVLARRRRRVELGASYSEAVMWAKGYGAEETRAALEQLQAVATLAGEMEADLPVYIGHWTRHWIRGELAAARALAESRLRQPQSGERPAFAAVARRHLGTTALFQGALAEAEQRLEQALGEIEASPENAPGRRFGADNRVAALTYLALTKWLLGEAELAEARMDEAQAQAAASGDATSVIHAKLWGAVFEILRDRPAAALRAAEHAAALSREHDMPLYERAAAMGRHWALGRLSDPAAAADELRAEIEAFDRDGNRIVGPLYRGMLAELMLLAGHVAGGLSQIESGLALARETGMAFADAFLHRLRGDALAAGDAAAAEAAYAEAVAIAQRQGARALELKAALALARLLRCSNRLLDARDVLARALEGFAPAPELPTVAEARALLDELAATAEVRTEEEQARRRTQMRVAYANALIASRGFSAPETIEAFARARDLAAGASDATDRVAADFGLWAASYTRGDVAAMRRYAVVMRDAVRSAPEAPEAGVAHRAQGVTEWFAGDYREASKRLEQALALFKPGRDDDMALRFGPDLGVSSMAYLAFALWPLGEIERAASLVEGMRARMAGVSHANTLALGHMYMAQFALLRSERGRPTEHTLALARLAHEHDLAQSRAFATFFQGWAQVETDPSSGLANMRSGVESLKERGILIFDGLVKIALARAEASAGDAERAVAILCEAIASAEQRNFLAFLSELHRARGDLLLQRDAEDFGSAEQAYRAAVAIAKRQGARSYVLLASLGLARLLQSTSRMTEAREVLAPALEGFRPTPELPAIANAQSLLAELERRGD